MKNLSFEVSHVYHQVLHLAHAVSFFSCSLMGFLRSRPWSVGEKTQRQSLGDYLVGGWPTPLKNMTRQLGWKHVPNWMEQIKFMFHTTNQLSMANWDNRYSDTPSNQSQMGLLPPSTQKRMGGVGQYTECRVFTGTSSRAPHLGLGWLVYLDGAPIFLTMACPQYN